MITADLCNRPLKNLSLNIKLKTQINVLSPTGPLSLNIFHNLLLKIALPDGKWFPVSKAGENECLLTAPAKYTKNSLSDMEHFS